MISPSSHSRPARAFTLIELLIVIAIIGILMSLLFPAVNSAIDAARKAQAKNDAVQIATAVTAFEAEYGRLPGTATDDQTVTVAGDILRALTGQNTNDNPRGIVFLEVQAWKKGKSGTNASGEFRDPWNGAYQMRLDYGWNNELTSVGTNSQTIRKKVAVWNNPTTQSNTPANQRTRRYVTSWE